MEKGRRLNKLEYEEGRSAQKALSRFGVLKIPSGARRMPCISPSIRTGKDARAVIENIAAGMDPQVITLYLSYRRSFLPTLSTFLGRTYSDASIRLAGPLVIPDIESEALSFNCIARAKYLKQSSPPSTVRRLLDTCLSKDKRAEGRYNAHSTWKEIRTSYGTTSVKDWLVGCHTAAGAEVFFAPSPILRIDLSTIGEAFKCGYSILDEARADFAMSGMHLLIHGELFKDDDDADIARNAIYSEIDKWSTVKEQYSGTFLSFKVHDPSKILLEPMSGQLARRNLSEFVTELSERVRKSNGALITHNFANLCLGPLNSGADVATFRVSGNMKIDTPISRPKGKRPKREVTSVMDPGSLSMVDVSEMKESYEQKGSFPVPSCVGVIPFWEMPDLKSREIYERRMRCGRMVELGEEYRDAGLDKSILLKDALRSLVMNSEERQKLTDLCPSLS